MHNGSDPPGSRLVHNKKSQPVDQLQFCPRHVHDSFTTDFYSRLVHDKIILDKWSTVGSVAGDLANLRP
jgi:hypothetical protein